MLRKYSILLGMIISLLLLLIAIMQYPGGSRLDKHSIGYDWQNNYISNLFGNQAVNGSANASQPWAIGGMLFLGASFAMFFVEFSRKITLRSAANIIKYFGVGAAIATFLTVTPAHDLMITIASTLMLVSMFYITVFVFRTKLILGKVLCILCLLLIYACVFIYYSRNFEEFLPVVQKAGLVITVVWSLYLQYFTGKEDFEKAKQAGG